MTQTWGAITWAIWWWAIGIALEYFGIWDEALIIMSILLAVDFVMWIADAYLLDPQTVTSSKMWRGLAKKITRRLLPFIVVIVIKWAGIESVEYLTNIVMWIIILSEWYSIISHIYSINTWDKLSEIDTFKILLSFIANLFKSEVEKKEIVSKWTKKKN